MNQMTFNKNEVIIRHGQEYPTGAMVVDGYDQEGNLLAHPLGGGLQYKIGAEQQENLRLVTPRERRSAPFRMGRFLLEGSPTKFEGWTDGTLWNGWATPHFELETAKRVIKAIQSPKASFDEKKDAFLTESPDGEAEVWQAEQIQSADGKQIKGYPIGAWSWCWDEVE